MNELYRFNIEFISYVLQRMGLRMLKLSLQEHRHRLKTSLLSEAMWFYIASGILHIIYQCFELGARRLLTRSGDDGHAKAGAKTGEGSSYSENSVTTFF